MTRIVTTHYRYTRSPRKRKAVALLVWCKGGCQHQAEADLQKLIDAGRGDVPLTQLPEGQCAWLRPICYDFCYNYGMAKGNGFPDPVSEAFRRVSQDARARRETGTPPAHQPINWVIVALGVLVLALIVLGIVALLEGWVFPG